MLDYIRIACAVPAVKVGDVTKNTEDICAFMEQADAKQVDLLLFPELAMTGYTCGDLFYQEPLHDAVDKGLGEILACSKKYPALTCVVGLPVRMDMQLLNCAAVIHNGILKGMVSKTYLPDYGGFNESRWFSSVKETQLVSLCGQKTMVGTDLLYKIGGVTVGIEICEDFFAPVSPSTFQALNGAEVILNLAASPEQVGKKFGRTEQMKVYSGNCKCIYAYCSAGYTESTTDLVFSGHSVIAECGTVLQENVNVVDSGYLMVQDCDLGIIRAERRKNATFRMAAQRYAGEYLLQNVMDGKLRADGTLYPVQKLPFIPSTQSERLAYCNEIFQLQVTGLKQRLTAIGGANAVIGISGGLDSTLALLVAVEAMRQMDRPASDVYGVTMPCFGTSDRTYNNSWELMNTLGINSKEIVIKDAVSLHFQDIGHDPAIHNATYENSQARERTQILMDYASVVGGIVVGTGDLSELALGWCTYNGDHMSMYGVNGTVPKTLIRWIIDTISQRPEFAASRKVLEDILDTPISPELLPPDAEGKISQQTEDLVGPYALHDFYLYYVLRYGFAPEKIYTLACRAFAKDFDAATIKKWLKSFYRRFFTQQFKRSCMPDGVKVGAVGLGPRGDWNMPSDASARIWLDEVDKL
ncbi:MAG: NAD(+) synthase [Oscillospiraceae bacterium]|nr:NAD(+) synthase [Oscillospiraceae bacterium]